MLRHAVDEHRDVLLDDPLGLQRAARAVPARRRPDRVADEPVDEFGVDVLAKFTAGDALVEDRGPDPLELAVGVAHSGRVVAALGEEVGGDRQQLGLAHRLGAVVAAPFAAALGPGGALGSSRFLFLRGAFGIARHNGYSVLAGWDHIVFPAASLP